MCKYEVLHWVDLFRKDFMKDLDKIIEGQRKLYEFLVQFNSASALNRKIVLKNLEKQIKDLEKQNESGVNNG